MAVYAAAAVATGFVDLRVRSYPDYAYQTYIPAVIDGTYGAPAIYRVLMPFGFDWLVRATGAAPSTIWHASRLLLCAASFATFHWYLRTWFTATAAMTGTLTMAALLPLTFTNSWAHPDHFAELLLFTLGCSAVARNMDILFGCTLLVAAFNRETAVFLLPLYLLGGPLTKTRLVKAIGFGGLFGAVFVGLRWWRGFQHYEYWQLWKNIEFLKLLPPPRDPYYRAYAWFGAVLAAPLALLASRNRSSQPLFIRRATWVAPMFAVVAITISSIIESRIFTPLFPLLLPAVVFTIVQADAAELDRSQGLFS